MSLQSIYIYKNIMMKKEKRREKNVDRYENKKEVTMLVHK